MAPLSLTLTPRQEARLKKDPKAFSTFCRRMNNGDIFPTIFNVKFYMIWLKGVREYPFPDGARPSGPLKDAPSGEPQPKDWTDARSFEQALVVQAKAHRGKRGSGFWKMDWDEAIRLIKQSGLLLRVDLGELDQFLAKAMRQILDEHGMNRKIAMEAGPADGPLQTLTMRISYKDGTVVNAGWDQILKNAAPQNIRMAQTVSGEGLHEISIQIPLFLPGETAGRK